MSTVTALAAEFINVDSWIDIIDHIIVGLILIAVAAVPAWLSARNHKGIRSLQDQVVNGHKNPLRLDLDKLISSVEHISSSLHGLREELVEEEHRRRESIKELRDDFDRKFRELNNRIK